ncbi:MAG: hypothetical protein GC191_03200 [Azospirillum sp.]|nr:hypothetical protein [Azospirillum sp.]
MFTVTTYPIAIVILGTGLAGLGLRRWRRGEPPDLFAVDVLYFLCLYALAVCLAFGASQFYR